MVRFAKGGGDANAVAIRIARAYTERDKVLICGYHEWHDWYLAANLEDNQDVQGHPLPRASCTGVPKALVGTSTLFAYNDLADLAQKLEANRGEVACIIMEPARFLQPEPGFLEGVRKLADEHKAVLIFDEVVTGFRYGLGGAQERFGVIPDMTTHGKAIGNGYPISAIVGRADVMSAVKKSFVSSSYWSEPSSIAAAIVVQRILRKGNAIEHVWTVGKRLQEGIKDIGRDSGVPFTVEGLPPNFRVGLQTENPAPLMTLITQEMAKRGVHMTGIVYPMAAHKVEDIDIILTALRETAAILQRAIDQGSVTGLLEVPEASSLFRRRQV